MICLDDKYSTTKVLTKEQPENTLLFLPENTNRKVEGGLRTKGYFKKSYDDKPLISIITVVYNGDQELQKTIDSVVFQSYDNIEYIIIDGCSSDCTVDIIKKNNDKIDYWLSESDDGIYDAMNKGISLINEKDSMIQLLNCGDVLDSNDTISKVVSIHKNEVDVIFGNYKVINKSTNTLKNIISTTQYWLHMSISHQSLFIRKSVYDIVGEYNNKLKISADYDYLIRLFLENKKFLKINENIVIYDGNGVSAIKLPETYRETNMIHKKYFSKFILIRYYFLFRMYKNLLKFYIKRLLK